MKWGRTRVVAIEKTISSKGEERHVGEEPGVT